MSYEINLTEEQQQRIEEAQTPEEKVRVFNEALRDARSGAELSEDDLDTISGGGTKCPPTMEGVKDALTTVQFLINNYGLEMANLWLEENDYPTIKQDARAGLSDLRRYWTSKVQGTENYTSPSSAIRL